MPSTQPQQHPHQQHSSSSSPSHPLHPYGANSGVGSSSSSRATQSAPTQQLFSDERRDAIALPKIETDAASVVSSHPSSPYSSPHLAPRGRAGAIGNMEEVTLPPIQAAVPMRRGAVSGASSGPSLPFPPIRLSYEDEDVPSRGPSPTLGKRSSFSMGHSNHVPPGPEVQLPTPVLSGSGERRGGIASTSSYVAVHALYHGGDGDVPRSEGLGGNQPGASGQRPNLPWMQHKSTVPHAESADHAPPHHPFQPSSPSPANSFTSHRPSHFNDEPSHLYSHAQQPAHPHHHSYPPSSSGGYRYDFHREGSAMSPGSNHSLLPGEHHSPLSPRMHSTHMMPSEEQHHHLLQDVDPSLNGKRPRSAPRVMSSQPRIFACSQCPARFARNHDLKRHQRGHLSVRPYPCNWCGKSFSRKDALKRHILVKVSGQCWVSRLASALLMMPLVGLWKGWQRRWRWGKKRRQGEAKSRGRG